MGDQKGRRTKWYIDNTDNVVEVGGSSSLETDILVALLKAEEGIIKFKELLEERTPNFKATIASLRLIADGVDHFHHGATIANITGSAVSAAGGITTVVGLILSPFTFGASLIVTGVGLGVAAAGGVASASATISDTVKERVERGKVEDLIRKYETDMKEIELCLKSIHCQLQRLSCHPDYSRIKAREMQALALKALPRASRGISNVIEIVKLAALGKAAGGLVRGIRMAGVAAGVLTGLFLVMDAIYIAKDAKELQQGAKTKAAKKIREAASELEKGLRELRTLGKSFESSLV